jgi:hypothetical protein
MEGFCKIRKLYYFFKNRVKFNRTLLPWFLRCLSSKECYFEILKYLFNEFYIKLVWGKASA